MFKDGKMSGYGRMIQQSINEVHENIIIEGVFKDNQPYGPFISLPLATGKKD